MAYKEPMRAAYFSRHVPKAKLYFEDGKGGAVPAAKELMDDICEFNAIRRDSFSLYDHAPASESSKDSHHRIHAFLGKKYPVNNTYYHAAEDNGNAGLKSALECQKLNIADKKARLEKLDNDAAGLKRRLACDQKGKDCLIRRSKEGKHYKYPLQPHSGRIEETKDGKFIIRQGKKVTIYDNAYLFEVQFLDPEIKQLKRDIRNKGLRAVRMKNELDELKQRDKAGRASVCFGTKALFYDQFRENRDHEAWKREFDHQRNGGMTISGCAQAEQGNYAFEYSLRDKELKYTTFHGRVIIIPGVEFPYGQEYVDCAVRAGMEGAEWDVRRAIAWRIEDCGNDIVVKCMPGLPEAPDNSVSVFRENGCFGIDQNYDNISLSETDKHGNLLHHQVFPFSLEGLKSGQATAVLSSVLDDVFDIIKGAGKPVVYEDIGNIKAVLEGGSPGTNYKLSMFAHNKISWLVKSKAYRLGIPARKVNPRYTSQIGKVKYMKKYGLTVHEAAAFVIARRGMGLKERIYPSMRGMIPAMKKNRHHWAHWAAMFRALKEMYPRFMYRKIDYGRYADTREMAKEFKALAKPPP